MHKPNNKSLRTTFYRRLPLAIFAVAAVCLLTAGTAQAGLGTSLQLCSTMENTTPYLPNVFWEDVSGNDHYATTNPAAYDDTLNGRATAVDFTSGELNIPVNDGLNTDFDPGIDDYSVSFWYNDVAAKSSCLLSKGNYYTATPGYSLRTDAAGELYLRMEDVQGYDETKISLNSGLGSLTGTGWHHVAAVFDRSGTVSGTSDQVLFYVDNVVRASTVLPYVDGLDPYVITNNTAEFLIAGQSTTSSGYNFNGYMDDVAVYRGALSATNVSTLYNASEVTATTVTSNGIDTITPVAIHNFATNRDQNETIATVPDNFDGQLGKIYGSDQRNVITQVTDATRGEVLDFATVDREDYVSYGDVLDPGSTSYTASFWFNVDDTGESQMLASKGCNRSSVHDGWAIILANGNVYFRTAYEDSSEIDYKPSLSKAFSGTDFGQWHHLAVVIDQENHMLKAYLDGQGSGITGIENGWTPSETYGFTIAEDAEFYATEGREFDIKYDELCIGLSRYGVDGQIDDFSVWSRALSDAEILSLFNGADMPPSTVSIPGDTNGDNVVNAADAEVLGNHWGETEVTAGAAFGDFNDDGVVNAKDASILAANWGDHNEAAGPSSVPEPSSLVLIVLGVLMSAISRRRVR